MTLCTKERIAHYRVRTLKQNELYGLVMNLNAGTTGTSYWFGIGFYWLVVSFIRFISV